MGSIFAQADLGRTVLKILRLCSGSAQARLLSAQACSPSAQVKAAVAHVRRLKRNQRKGKLILSLRVSSIDGFQGREADIVAFVTVRCNVHYDIGFLKDLRRMNVALTRARAAVIIIGHRATLTLGTANPESTAVWKRLLGKVMELKIEIPL